MILSVSTVRQAVTIIPASICVFAVGLGYGWTAPTIKQLKNSTSEFSLDTEECSWVASLPEFFRIIGTVVVFAIVDIFGRKKLYFSCPILFAISWSMLLVNRSVWTLYIGRSIFGLGLGINDALSLIYLPENSSPQMRGIFGSIHVSFCLSGILLIYVLCSYLSYSAVLSVNLILQFFVITCMIFMKEPAQFLIMKGHYDKAEKVFFWLRASESPEVKFEYDDMVKRASEENGKSSFGEVLRRKANYRSLTVVILISLLLGLTGARTISAYLTISFSKSSAVSAETLTIVQGVVVLICAMVSSSFIEHFNRKTIFVAGLLGSGIASVISAVLYYWQENISELPQFTWMIFSSLLLYFIVCSLTLSPIYNIVFGELLAQNVRPFGSCLTTITNSLTATVTTFLFLQVAETYGAWYNFGFFALASFFTIAYVCLYMPEVRGKSLVEIQSIFER